MRRADEWLQALALALAIAPGGERELLGKITEIFAGVARCCCSTTAIVSRQEWAPWPLKLLRGTEQLKILATSQQQLSFVGERVLRLPPLELPALAAALG